MPKVVVRAFGCSLDGFGAGLQQSQSEPFGKNAIQIVNWCFPSRTSSSMRGAGPEAGHARCSGGEERAWSLGPKFVENPVCHEPDARGTSMG